MKEITNSNYQDYTKIDIAAFSYAYEGAMGEGGGICIIDREGELYHANYYYGNDYLEPEHVKEVIPAIEEIEFYLFGCKVKNENWEFVYLGFGNNLFIASDLAEGFKKKMVEEQIDSAADLYLRWQSFVLDLVE